MPETTSNQMHGKSFENCIKSSNRIFSHAAADRARSPNERFDIASEDDTEHGLNTSIKATGSNSVGLSDAREFWKSMEFLPYRFLIGKWKQDQGNKKFTEIHEIILKGKYKDILLGSLSLEDVTEFHKIIRSHGPGPEQQKKAQNCVKEHRKKIDGLGGLVKLNPKIDSKNQRRLQCSISLSALVKNIDQDDYTLHKGRYNNLVLPFSIISSPRKLKSKKH